MEERERLNLGQIRVFLQASEEVRFQATGASCLPGSTARVNVKAEMYWGFRLRAESGQLAGLTDEPTIVQLVAFVTDTTRKGKSRLRKKKTPGSVASNCEVGNPPTWTVSSLSSARATISVLLRGFNPDPIS
jgi:hypothetical protein